MTKQNLMFYAKKTIAFTFSGIFIIFSISIMVNMLVETALSINETNNFLGLLLKSISQAIVALAVLELAIVVYTEYATTDEVQADIHQRLLVTIPRFIATISIALALEGLVMVIKYSNNTFYGNDYFPILTVVSAGFLLTALAAFLFAIKAYLSNYKAKD